MPTLGLDHCKSQPYSIRRGGATYGFFLHGSLDTTLVRGCWGSAKTGRTYIQVANEAMARLEANLSEHMKVNEYEFYDQFLKK